MSVIDIGCGAGDKLLAFKALYKSLKITGVELHPTMVAFARYVAPFANVIEGDAFKQDYSQYDLLYMYRPIPDKALQAKLQRYVMRSMKRGAVLIVRLHETKWSPKKDANGWYPFDEKGKEFPDLEKGWRKP